MKQLTHTIYVYNSTLLSQEFFNHHPEYCFLHSLGQYELQGECQLCGQMETSVNFAWTGLS